MEMEFDFVGLEWGYKWGRGALSPPDHGIPGLLREVGRGWDTPLTGGRKLSAVWDAVMAGAPAAL